MYMYMNLRGRYEEGWLAQSRVRINNHTVSAGVPSLISRFKNKPQIGNSELLVRGFPRFYSLSGFSLEINYAVCGTES